MFDKRYRNNLSNNQISWRLIMIMKPKKLKKALLVVVIIILTITAVFIVSYFGEMQEKDVMGSGNSIFQNTGDKELYAFLLDLDKTMADALKVDLSNYRKVDTLDGFTNSEYDELRLLDVKMQIPSTYGDSILSIYLNKDNTKGIALKQGIAQTKEFKGTYNMYLFEPDLDEDNKFAWKIGESKFVEGEYRAVNDAVKEYFMKNRTAKNELQQSSFEEDTSTSQVALDKNEAVQQAKS